MPVAEKMKEIPGVYLTSFCHMIHTQASHRHFIKYPFHMIHGHSDEFETVSMLEMSQK